MVRAMEPGNDSGDSLRLQFAKEPCAIGRNDPAAGPMLPMLSNPAIFLDKYRPSAYIPDIPVTQTTRRSGAYT